MLFIFLCFISCSIQAGVSTTNISNHFINSPLESTQGHVFIVTPKINRISQQVLNKMNIISKKKLHRDEQVQSKTRRPLAYDESNELSRQSLSFTQVVNIVDSQHTL